MSEQIWIAVIAAVPPTLAALASLFYIRSLHRQINSRMEEFIVIVKKVARAEGVEEGKRGIDPPA